MDRFSSHYCLSTITQKWQAALVIYQGMLRLVQSPFHIPLHLYAFHDLFIDYLASITPNPVIKRYFEA